MAEVNKRRSGGAADAKSDERSYTVRVFCENCGQKDDVDISFGDPVENHPCATCGVRTLRRSS